MQRRAVVAALAAMLASAGATAQERAGGPASSAAPLFNAEDLQFLRHMSMHHEQALEMAALVPERTQRDEFVRFARYVSRAQAAEIDMMQALLGLAAERGLAVPGHGLHGDPPMPGMLSSAQMAALEGTAGAEFERLWLEGMIFHHEGGLAMARAQQLQQLENGRRPYGFHVLVEDILIEQRAEITKMTAWLDAWGLESGAGADAGDSTPPVAAVTSPAPGTAVAVGPVALIGTAVDDASPITSVRVGIRNVATGEWWRSSRSWGERRLHDAEIVRSGPSSAAWKLGWAPPAPGGYDVVVEAQDGAGNRAAGMGGREVDVQ